LILRLEVSGVGNVLRFAVFEFPFARIGLPRAAGNGVVPFWNA